MNNRIIAFTGRAHCQRQVAFLSKVADLDLRRPKVCKYLAPTNFIYQALKQWLLPLTAVHIPLI